MARGKSWGYEIGPLSDSSLRHLVYTIELEKPVYRYNRSLVKYCEGMDK